MGADQSKPAYQGSTNTLGGGSSSSQDAPYSVYSRKQPGSANGGAAGSDDYKAREARAEAAERRFKSAPSTTTPSKTSPSPSSKALTPPSESSSPLPSTSLPTSTSPSSPASTSPLVPDVPTPSASTTHSSIPTPSGREALAEAAERRAKSAQSRGTNASNPKRGQLAAKVAKPLSKTPTPSEPERLIWE